MAHKPIYRKEPTLRATRVVYLMTMGAKFTTMEIAQLTGMSRWGARLMMETISSSHDVPVTHLNGYWQILSPWDLARRDCLDPSKLSAEELQQLSALMRKMTQRVELPDLIAAPEIAGFTHERS